MTVDDQIIKLIKKMNAFEKRALDAEEENTRLKNDNQQLRDIIKEY